MNTSNGHQNTVKYDYGSLFLGAILLMGTAGAVEGMTSPVGRFFQGLLIGMSIACTLIGFILYLQSSKQR
jgi:hypothetical protein